VRLTASKQGLHNLEVAIAEVRATAAPLARRRGCSSGGDARTYQDQGLGFSS
jgi:hypothetical protein